MGGSQLTTIAVYCHALVRASRISEFMPHRRFHGRLYSSNPLTEIATLYGPHTNRTRFLNFLTPLHAFEIRAKNQTMLQVSPNRVGY